MHGRVKVRTTAEQEKIREAEKRKKASIFKKGIELVFEKRKNGVLDNEILATTEKLLAQLPDVYTLWNIRREAFLDNNWSDDERIENLERELYLIETCLRENPKSYCAWHHRQWVIEHLPNPNWQRELNLCNKCLNMDDRNFHCWNYRRLVVLKACVSDEEELGFTTNKIMNNFSNYSSWHYRSKLLPRLYPSDTHDLPIRFDKYNEELDIVMNATFTDPNDTSAWIYQRWLLDCWEPTSKLWRAVCTDTKVIAVFYKEVSPDLSLFVDGEEIVCKWISVTGENFSSVWSTEIPKISISNSQKVLKFLGLSYQLIPCSIQNSSIYADKVLASNCNNPQLKEQLESYQTLVELEPNNKWARLTTLHLMLLADFQNNFSDIMKELEHLVEIDPLRANYYKDMRSKYTIRHHLSSCNDEGNPSREIDLCGLGLTTLSDQGHYLTFYQSINMSNNNLGNKLYQLKILYECTKLDLSNNHITSLKGFPELQNLEVLLLSNNQISEYQEIVELMKILNLKKIDLRGNPITDKDSLSKVAENLSAQVEILI